jgi:hypothetical protein
MPSRNLIAPLADAGRALARQPDMTMPASRLLLAATQLDDQLIDHLTKVCVLVAEQPMAATHLAGAFTHRVATDSHADPDTVHSAAAHLERDGGLAAGPFAVALTSYGQRIGWPAEWRNQLRRLRQHPLADVRTTALAIVTAAE